jgi:hypothetical protein
LCRPLGAGRLRQPLRQPLRRPLRRRRPLPRLLQLRLLQRQLRLLQRRLLQRRRLHPPRRRRHPGPRPALSQAPRTMLLLMLVLSFPSPNARGALGIFRRACRSYFCCDQVARVGIHAWESFLKRCPSLAAIVQRNAGWKHDMQHKGPTQARRFPVDIEGRVLEKQNGTSKAEGEDRRSRRKSRTAQMKTSQAREDRRSA